MSAVVAERWVDERADLALWLMLAPVRRSAFLDRARRRVCSQGPAPPTELAVLAAKARLDRERAREAWHRANPSHRRKAQPEARMRRSIIEILIGTTAMMLAFAAFDLLVLR